MSSEDWMSDLVDESDDTDETEESSPDAGGLSIFESNFKELVESGEVADFDLDTLEAQVSKVETPALLDDAVSSDPRDDARSVYEERLGELNTEDLNEESSGGDETDSSQGSSDTEHEPTDETSDEETTQTPSVPTGDPVESALSESAASESNSGGEQPQSDAGESESAPHDDLGFNVQQVAPDAVSRTEAAESEKVRSLFVWGPEGSGKTHVAHTAPGPICYIDTEGKADELAPKFSRKRIWYFEVGDYSAAKDAMQQSLTLLRKVKSETGVRGTIVVDSMTALWEYSKVDYAKYKYQTEDLSEVDFKSQLQGGKDWTKIRARHNDEFRDVILDSPFHVVLTSGEKENYNYDEDAQDFNERMTPDGEKRNEYAVKEVVRLKIAPDGQTVGSLRKAAKTRFSFMDMEWPDWNSIYGAIDRLYEAEQSAGSVDVSDWEFSVVKGQPVNGGESDE